MFFHPQFDGPPGNRVDKPQRLAVASVLPQRLSLRELREEALPAMNVTVYNLP
jgi:hypothetical protein